MKNRTAIYKQEAEELLRLVSCYPGLSSELLAGFFPSKEERVQAVLTAFQKEGRLFRSENGGYFSNRDVVKPTDSAMVKGVYVLLDFLEQVEYHTAGDLPDSIVFFAEGEMVEILCVEKGQETFLKLLLTQKPEPAGKRLVIVEDTSQIPKLTLPGIAAFCTVSETGEVRYYQEGKNGSGHHSQKTP